jgi:hypothetical protein
MKSTIRSALLGTTATILAGISGCGENNESRVDSGGVTPPGAATSSEDGLKAKNDTKSANPYKGMMGPKVQPSRKSPKAAAPATDSSSTPEKKS